MSKFTPLKPEEVTVGRGIAAAVARQPYIEAVREIDAGRIDLERGDKPATVKRLLQEAGKAVGLRLRSSYVEAERALYWKKVPSRP